MASQSCWPREDLEEQPLSLSASACVWIYVNEHNVCVQGYFCVSVCFSECPRKTGACVGVSGDLSEVNLVH